MLTDPLRFCLLLSGLWFSVASKANDGKEGKIQGYAIGIDLGTTYSCVGVMKNNQVCSGAQPPLGTGGGYLTSGLLVRLSHCRSRLLPTTRVTALCPLMWLSPSLSGMQHPRPLTWLHVCGAFGCSLEVCLMWCSLIGEAAKNQAAMNPKNTIFDAKRLIGRNFSDKIVQDDMKLWPFKVSSASLELLRR